MKELLAISFNVCNCSVILNYERVENNKQCIQSMLDLTKLSRSPIFVDGFLICSLV